MNLKHLIYEMFRITIVGGIGYFFGYGLRKLLEKLGMKSGLAAIIVFTLFVFLFVIINAHD